MSKTSKSNGRSRLSAFKATRISALCFLVVSAAASGASAADVTYERLLNPDKEPHNWLMNHRDFGAQRHSPLATSTSRFATGLTRNQVGRLAHSPETRTLAKHATMIFVFGL